MEDSANHYDQEIGQTGKAESYRPISLLSVLLKLFDKLLLPKLSVIMERQKIIPDHQFGFRQKHTTIEQM